MCMIIAGENVIVCVWLLQVKMWLYVYLNCRWRCGCVELETWIFFFARSILVLWYMFRLSYNKRDIYRTLSLELSCRTVYGYLIVQSLIIWVFQFLKILTVPPYSSPIYPTILDIVCISFIRKWQQIMFEYSTFMWVYWRGATRYCRNFKKTKIHI